MRRYVRKQLRRSLLFFALQTLIALSLLAGAWRLNWLSCDLCFLLHLAQVAGEEETDMYKSTPLRWPLERTESRFFASGVVLLHVIFSILCCLLFPRPARSCYLNFRFLYLRHRLSPSLSLSLAPSLRFSLADATGVPHRHVDVTSLLLAIEWTVLRLQDEEGPSCRDRHRFFQGRRYDMIWFLHGKTNRHRPSCQVRVLVSKGGARRDKPLEFTGDVFHGTMLPS